MSRTNQLNQRHFALIIAGCLLSAVLGAAPAALAQAEPAEAPVAAAVQVELAFGTDLDRETRGLVGESETFAADGFSAEAGQIFCLTRVINAAAPTTVTHVWYHEGKTMAKVDLNVGSADWRTWSSKRLLPTWTGNWEVKVLDANGMVLGSRGFVVN